MKRISCATWMLLLLVAFSFLETKARTPHNHPTPTPNPTPTPTPTPTPVPTPTTSVPTLVQHVATGMDRWPVTTLAINLPNPAGGGNALILGVQFKSFGSISSVSDNQGNTWV